MKEHSINKKNNFIKGFYINKKICNGIINLFNDNKNLWAKGRSGKHGVDPKIKLSTDISIPITFCNDLNFNKYKECLASCLEEYKKYYKYCDQHQNSWEIREKINIQRYLPNEGFFSWHFENTGASTKVKNRHLVFMTYLNNVPKGGTEFFNQKIKIEAEQGLTLIWPAIWTHTHRGIISKTNTKYIITGWYSYLDQ